MTLTAKQAAEQLDGCEYGNEGSPDLWKQMHAAGLVAVFGASDDLMEFYGAIYDEVDAYGGCTAKVTRNGLPKSQCDDDDCPYFLESIKHLPTIEAVWGDDHPEWSYRTTIPHETFNVMEDSGIYCVGIVFSLSDLPE